MNWLKSLIVSVVMVCVGNCYAAGELTINDIVNNSYGCKNLGFVYPIGNETFAQVGGGGRQIVAVSYKDGKQTDVIFDMDKKEDAPEGKIYQFEFSWDQNIVLFSLNAERINRESFEADYYTYNFRSKELLKVSEDDEKQVQATLSPNGEMVAFVEDNNLLIRKLKFGTVTPVTKDGACDTIINGIADWVYEEEFGILKSFEWSPDSKELAFVKYDESKVNQYAFLNYTYRENASVLPDVNYMKYPQAGKSNSKLAVCVYNVKSRKTKQMDLGNDEELYVTKIQWTNVAGELAVVKLNRRQNVLGVLLCNSASTLSDEILTEKSTTNISPTTATGIHFLVDGKYFIYWGEESGYKHLYLYTVSGSLVRQLTSGEFDVTEFYGVNEELGLIYYQAAKESPLNREVYAVGIDGKKHQKLSFNEGINGLMAFGSSEYYLLAHESNDSPLDISSYDVKGRKYTSFVNNSHLKERVDQEEIPEREFFSFKNSEDVELNGWMIKPADFTESQKYPAVFVQYSGAESQRVLNGWSISWYNYLASSGYVVVCVDGRGTGARGVEFRQDTYMNLGELEAEDQIAAAEFIGQKSFVDADRLAIFGTSYGGFITCSVLCSETNVFKLGIAVAPVTDWRFYNTIYTERYMRKPEENPKGYLSSSLIENADKLSGRLFIVHGAADNNVHFSNTMNYVDALVEAGKLFDMFVYPNQKHSLSNRGEKKHFYNMLTDYLNRNL